MTSHSTTRTVTLLIIVALAGSFVVATGASISGPADTIADDRVVIQPGENTDYTYLDANDELVLDFTAANPNLDADGEGVNLYALTGFSELFRVTYTADEMAHVWIAHDNDQLTFTVDGQPVNNESNNVTLTQDQSISVGLTIDTTETNVMTGQISEDDFSIHAKVLDAEDGGADDSPSGDGGDDDDTGSDDSSGSSSNGSSTSGGADDDESDGTEDGDSTGSDDDGADGNDCVEFEDGNNGDGAGAAGGEDDDEPVEEPGGFELIDLTYLLLILLMVIISSWCGDSSTRRKPHIHWWPAVIASSTNLCTVRGDVFQYTVNQTDTASADAGFFSELSQAVHRVDLLVLAVVPLVMIGVFFLPEETRRAFAFQYTEPTFLTAFTAHYVHLTVEHLLGNLVGYCLLATSGYTLSVLAGKRRFFLTTLVTFLCVFPFVLSALNLAVPRHAIGYGFSGVNMAFVGLLPLALASYGRVQFFPASTVQFLPAVFLITTGWITMLALPLSTTGIGLASTAIALGSLIAGVLYFVLVLPVRRWQFRSWIRTILARGYYSDLFVLGLALFIAYPIIGFPSNPIAGGSVLNLYVHLLGFCLGFIGPYTLLSMGLFSQ